MPAFSVARTSDPWRAGYAWRSYADGVRRAGKSLRIDGDGPLHVFAPGFAPALFADHRPDESGALVVRLHAGAVVRGRVVDERGFGVSGATVEAVASESPRDPFVSARAGRVRPHGPWAESDDGGHFELRFVPSGRWRLRAGARGYAPSEGPVLRTSGGAIHTTPSIALGASATLVVCGGDGGLLAEDPKTNATTFIPGSEELRLDLAPGEVVRLRRRSYGCVDPPTCTATAPTKGAVAVDLP